MDLPVPRKCLSLTPHSQLANPVSGLTAWVCSRVSLEGLQAGSQGHGLGHTQAPPKYPEENTRPAVRNELADNSQMPLHTPGKKCAQMPLDRTQNPQKKARWSPS